MAKRKAVSKKTRFDVFKRDCFKCQYCGSHPPKVILHVDHINPVANGGTNESDNLVTSCEACNLGKGARLLSSVPETLAAKASRIAEAEEQLRGYHEIMEAKLQREYEEVDRIAVLLSGRSDGSIPHAWVRGIKRFNQKLGIHRSIEAAEIALSKEWLSRSDYFPYYCGICWKWIREEEQNGQD
jgi:hypothetical protein